MFDTSIIFSTIFNNSQFHWIFTSICLQYAFNMTEYWTNVNTTLRHAILCQFFVCKCTTGIEFVLLLMNRFEPVQAVPIDPHSKYGIRTRFSRPYWCSELCLHTIFHLQPDIWRYLLCSIKLKRNFWLLSNDRKQLAILTNEKFRFVI